MSTMADRIITVIDDDGKSTRLGRPADEYVRKLPIKPNTSSFVDEVLRKVDINSKPKPLKNKED